LTKDKDFDYEGQDGLIPRITYRPKPVERAKPPLTSEERMARLLIMMFLFSAVIGVIVFLKWGR